MYINISLLGGGFKLFFFISTEYFTYQNVCFLKMKFLKTHNAITFLSRSHGRNLAGLRLLPGSGPPCRQVSAAGVFRRTKRTALSSPACPQHWPPCSPRGTEAPKAQCELRPWAAACAPTADSHRTHTEAFLFLLFPSNLTLSLSPASVTPSCTAREQLRL